MSGLPSLNALRAFDAVARLHSVSAAAAELAVTPSAVSRQISNLEEDIGVALLTRDGRGVRLTADGQRLGDSLGDSFVRIVSAVDGFRRGSGGNRLRILVPPVFASAWLIPRLDRFCARRPETDVVLIDKCGQVDGSEGADLVIGWGRFGDDDTTATEKLTDSEHVFPLCHKQACTGNGLAGATLLHREGVAEGWSWPDWSTFFDAVGLDSAGTVDGPHLSEGLILDAVRKGQGVMLANTTMAYDYISSGTLVRPIEARMPIDSYYFLLISKSERDRPEVEAFRTWLRKELAACAA